MLARRFYGLPQPAIAAAPACARRRKTDGKLVLRSSWLAPIAAGICFIASSPASAQLAGSVSIDSDYRFRGYSLSNGRPTATAQVSFDHSSNFYANAAVTAVDRTDGIDLLGYQANAGFARRISAVASVDVGITHTFDRYRYYIYGHDYQANAAYTEAYAGLSVRNVSARVYYSPHYFQAGASTLYGEIEAGIQPMSNLRLSAHLGGLTYLAVPDNPYFRYPSRYDWRLSASRQFGHFEIHSAVSGGGPHLQYSFTGNSGTAVSVGASFNL